ncbi:TPA: toprim domain-containing protein [Escherichia coli]
MPKRTVKTLKTRGTLPEQQGRVYGGLEYLPESGVVFVTESIFKAVALMNCGFNAVSALGSNISTDLRQQMSLLPYDWVCAGDNDKAGLKFSKTFTRGFVSNDLDELCEEEITYLARKFTR